MAKFWLTFSPPRFITLILTDQYMKHLWGLSKIHLFNSVFNIFYFICFSTTGGRVVWRCPRPPCMATIMPGINSIAVIFPHRSCNFSPPDHEILPERSWKFYPTGSRNLRTLTGTIALATILWVINSIAIILPHGSCNFYPLDHVILHRALTIACNNGDIMYR